MPGQEDEQADLILRKARQALEPATLPETFNATAPSSGEITDERLAAAYEALASMISVHGEQYLPLFKRLHTELESRRENEEFANLAKTIHNANVAP